MVSPAHPSFRGPTVGSRLKEWFVDLANRDTRAQLLRRGSRANRFFSVNRYVGTRAGGIQLRLRANNPSADPQDNLDYLYPVRLAPPAMTSLTPRRWRERKAEIMRLVEPSWANLSTERILQQPKATQKELLRKGKEQREEFLDLYVSARFGNLITKGVPFVLHEPFWLFGLGFEIYQLTRLVMGSMVTLSGYGILKRYRMRRKEEAAKKRYDELQARQAQRTRVIEQFVSEDPMRWVALKKAFEKNRTRESLNRKEEAALDAFQNLFMIPEESRVANQPSFQEFQWNQAGGIREATNDDIRLVKRAMQSLVEMAAVISREPVEGKFDRLDEIDRHFEDLMVYFGYASEGPMLGAQLEQAMGSRVSMGKSSSREERQKILGLIQRYNLRQWFGDVGGDPVADLRLAAAYMLKESTDVRFDMEGTGKMLPQVVAKNPLLAGVAAGVLAETNPRLRPFAFANIPPGPGIEPSKAYVAQKITRELLPKHDIRFENGQLLPMNDLVRGGEQAQKQWPDRSKAMRERIMGLSERSKGRDTKDRSRAGVWKLLNNVEVATRQLGGQTSWGPPNGDSNAAPDPRGPHYNRGVDPAETGDAATARASVAEASSRTARGTPNGGQGPGIGPPRIGFGKAKR